MDTDELNFAHWRADSRWRAIDLLSDVHLHPYARRTFDAWRSHLLDTPAEAVLILGDLLEVWVGDDSRFAGFGQECASVLREASTRRHVAFMPGNRDFLLGDEMLQACGLHALPDPTLAHAWGQHVLLTHGDRLCLADTAYQAFRHEVRSQRWRRAFLALPLEARSRQAQAMREASQAHQASMAPHEMGDVDPIEAQRWLDAAGAVTLVHGHTHRPASHVAADGRVRHVLGDWDFEVQPFRARLLRWTARGLAPIDLARE